MIIGPAIIKECPHCLQPFKRMTMQSGNSFGAIHWTDGKIEAPFMLEVPGLLKCPACQELFWLEEAREIGREGRIHDPQWSGVQGYLKPTEGDLLAFLEAGTALDDNKLRYVRLRAWWAANDPLRRPSGRRPQKNTGHSPRAQANMRALLTLLDHSDEKQRILKAELERELGGFEAAAALLSGRYSKENLPLVKYLKKLVEERNCRVLPLPQDQ